MKFNFTYKIIHFGLIATFAFLSFACQKTETKSASNASNTAAQTSNAAAEMPGAQTPTEAYKMLYAAVKAKETEKIKQMVTKETQGLAEFMAARGNQPIAKSYENGFTATTFAPELPEIRDERVKDNFGAIEVYNQQDKRWEDLPFIKEGAGWKLAIGDVFKDTFKSPGDPKSKIENAASNSAVNKMIAPMLNSNSNSKVNANVSSGKNKSIEVPVEPSTNKKSNK
jgi:anaerobic ribonucleoside-triphosphate reductase